MLESRRVFTSLKIALAGAGAALALSACSTLDKINPFNSVEFPPARLQDFKATLTPKVLWKNTTGKTETGVFQPVVLAGVVYVASQDGVIQAFDQATGKIRWRADVKTRLLAGVAATADTVVVVAPKGDVLAFDTDGKPRWKTNVGTEIFTPPAAAAGVIMIKVSDGRLLAYEADSGARRWAYARQNPTLTLRSVDGIAINGNLSVAGFPGGKMLAFSTVTGNLRWESSVANPKGATEIERIADVVGTPVVSSREACAATFQGRLGCFDLNNGNAVWTREFSTPVGFSFDDRYAIGPDEKGDIYAFSRDGGTNVWKLEALQRRQPSVPVVMGRSVVIADFEGYLHWVGRDDGKLLARFRPDGEPVSGPMVVSDKTLFVQTRNGAVYAIGLE